MKNPLISIGESIHASIPKTGKIMKQLAELGDDAGVRPAQRRFPYAVHQRAGIHRPGAGCAEPVAQLAIAVLTPAVRLTVGGHAAGVERARADLDHLLAQQAG